MNGCPSPMMFWIVKPPCASRKLLIAIDAAGRSRNATAKAKNGITHSHAHDRRTRAKGGSAAWCSACAICDSQTPPRWEIVETQYFASLQPQSLDYFTSAPT